MARIANQKVKIEQLATLVQLERSQISLDCATLEPTAAIQRSVGPLGTALTVIDLAPWLAALAGMLREAKRPGPRRRACFAALLAESPRLFSFLARRHRK